MNETIIDMLTENSVSILTKQYIEVNGQTYFVGNTRKAYDNSVEGRQRVLDELSESDSAAVLAKWGDTPTVEE